MFLPTLHYVSDDGNAFVTADNTCWRENTGALIIEIPQINAYICLQPEHLDRLNAVVPSTFYSVYSVNA
jgi:hypothetical protein